MIDPARYMEMDPKKNSNNIDSNNVISGCVDNYNHGINSMSSGASSCSVTSGTPSTDLRFAEYHLDKVTSRFTPDGEDAE